jgi:2-polyprenyl-6-methoxyphenol hydroxylase-like FAD-dependent oxidoreductase
LGERLTPRSAGQLIWRAAASRPPELTRYTVVNGPFGHLGLVPLSDTFLYLWLLQTDRGAPRTPPADRPAALRAALAGVGGHVAAVLDNLDDAVEIDQRSIAHLLVPPPWHRGRALLIGDAAHTTTPHLAFGVGMAIEDAVVLAELAAELDDVEALGEAFTARRYERCRFVVESSAQIAAWQTQTPPPIQDIQGLMGQAMGVLAKPYSPPTRQPASRGVPWTPCASRCRRPRSRSPTPTCTRAGSAATGGRWRSTSRRTGSTGTRR